MTEMRESEAVAKQVLEAVFPGAKMYFHEDQSHGECDFDLCYADGTKAAVEVTSITDGDWRRTMDNLRGTKSGKSVVKAQKCTKSWIVFLTPNARGPEIRKQIDGLLSEIERTWPDRVQGGELCLHDLWRDYSYASVSGPVLDSLRGPHWSPLQIDTAGKVIGKLGELGVCMLGSAMLSHWPSPPQIRLEGPVGKVYATAASIVTSAAEAEAQKEDNRKKLDAAGTQDRHLAVWVDYTAFAARSALVSIETVFTSFDRLLLERCRLPDAYPKLPDEITHLWVIAPVESKGFNVWYGSKTQKWRSVLVSECNRNVAE